MAREILLVSLLILAVMGLVIGCSSSITRDDMNGVLISSSAKQNADKDQLKEQYWFVKSTLDGEYFLKDFLNSLDDDVDTETLLNLIRENFGEVIVIYNKELADEFENDSHLNVSEIIVIHRPDGSRITVVRY